MATAASRYYSEDGRATKRQKTDGMATVSPLRHFFLRPEFSDQTLLEGAFFCGALLIHSCSRFESGHDAVSGRRSTATGNR